MRRPTPSILALLAVLAIGGVTRAHATDYHFSNLNGGAWNLATNWTPNGVPSLSTDRAFIDFANNGSVTITGGAVTVGSVSVGAGVLNLTQTLTLSGGARLTLTTGTSSVLSTGLLQLNGGSVYGAGTLSVAGVVRPTSGRDTIACPVTTTSGSSILVLGTGPSVSLTFAGSSQTRINGSLTLSGVVSSADTLCMAAGDTLYLMPGSTLTSAPFSGSTRCIRGALVNAGGVFNVNASTQFSSNGTVGSLTNLGNGTITVAAGTLTTDSLASTSVTNFGSIALSGGDLYLPLGGLSEYGPLGIAAGHRLRSKGGYFSVYGSNISGPGRLELVNTEMFVNVPGMSTQGLHVDIDGGGLDALAMGALTITPGDTLVSNNLVIGSPLVNKGTWIARGISDDTPGLFTSFSGSRLRIEANGAAAVFAALGLTNNGVIELTSSGTALLASAKQASLSVGFGITNMAGDSIVALQGVGGDRVVSGRIDNRGVISSQTGFDTGSIGTWRLRIDGAGHGAASNSGTLEAAGGHLNWVLGATDTLYNTGVLAMTGPSVMHVSHGHFRYRSGAVRTRLAPPGPYAGFAGQFSADTTDWVLDSDFAPDTLGINVLRSSVHGAGLLVGTPLTSLTADASTFDTGVLGSTSLTVRDTASFNAGLTCGLGAYTYVVGTSGGRRGRFVIPASIPNFGHMYLDGFGADATVTTQSGSFTVGPADSLEARYASGSAILATLANQGQVTIDAGSTLLVEKGASTHTNQGQIDVHGVLNVSNPAAPPAGMNFTNSGSIRVFDGTVNLNNAGTFTNGPSGQISGNGVLNISPATTFVNQGTISPGFSPGHLTINGAVSLASQAVTKVEISGSAAGTQFDQLNFTGGALSLSGTLQISISGCGFFPQAGDTFRVINAPSVTGSFSGVTGDAIGAGLSLQVLYRADGVTLLAVGTYTNQRPQAVDDYKSIAVGQEATLTPLQNDSDPDGQALSILSVLRAKYGTALIDPGATTLTYIPGENFSGVDTVTYVATDCFGGRDTAFVAVWVGGAAGVGEHQSPSLALRLAPPVPNPFSHTSTLSYDLPAAGHVTLAVYDLTGRLVRTLVEEPQAAGVHSARWDGRGSSSQLAPVGVYFARLRVSSPGGGTGVREKRLVLTR